MFCHHKTPILGLVNGTVSSEPKTCPIIEILPSTVPSMLLEWSYILVRLHGKLVVDIIVIIEKMNW
jgi:hypothetical protein